MKKNKKRIRKKSISLSSTMMMLVSMMTIFAITISVIIFVVAYRSDLYKTVRMNSDQVVTQTANTMDIYFQNMREDLNLVVDNVSACESESEIEEFINQMSQTRNDVASVMIYDADGMLLDYGVNGQELKSNIERNLSFNKDIAGTMGDEYISSPHLENLFTYYYPWVVTIIHKQYVDFYGQEVYIAMDVKFSAIASYLDEVGIGQYGYCYVIDQSNSIVYHPQQQILYMNLKNENVDEIGNYEDGLYSLDGTIYCIQTLSNENWRVVGVSYTGELVNERVNSILKVIVAASVVTIALTLFFVYLFSRRISKPIKELVSAMKKFESDTANFQYDSVGGFYEIQNLSESFAHMVGMIQQLMEKVKAEEITLRKTELKALQAQINPHFLYNTLDSILWMCEQERSKEAVEMVEALARLFRISISKGHEMITIENELNHAKSYLMIQSIRYKNQFHYEFHVDESILQYYCNKITLQPMLENAIYHGIDRMIDEGELTVTAKEDGDDIVFMVEDNGVGMTEEQCSTILESESNDKNGIGIKNVNDRFKIYFGDQYGVTIHSVPDEGTTIIIRFPKVEGDNNEAK